MAITNHIKGAVEKFKAKTGTDLQDHVLNATYLNGLEGTSYVDLTSAQTITGRKTFNSPANVNGQEVATAIFKTSNGGRLIIGKEGPNSGTMLRFDQTAGTTRLQFRASATPGAMVWTQPEKGATLYFDLTNSAGVSTRTTLDARSGTIARTSDIGNGKITIQKNGTEVGSFTTNQSSGKTINISLAKSDVGLGNVDNTADKDKNVKHASSAGTATNLKDSNHSYTATDVYDYLRFKEQKIAYRAITQQCDFAVALADLTSKQHRNYGGSIYDKLYHQPGYVQLVVRLDDDAEPLPNKFSNPSIGGYSEIVALTLDISDMIPASSEVYPPNPYMFFLLKHITDVQGNSGFYGSSPIVSGPKGAYGNDTVTFNVDLWFPDSEWEKKIGTATITCNATTSNIAGVYATKDELTDGLDTKANSSHTHAISEITNLQSTLNGKQATLVSGTNIKTINGNSILGSGNLSISADLSLGYDYEGFNTGFYNTQYDHKNLLNLSSATIQDDKVYKWGTVINVTPNDNSSMVQFYVPDGVGRNGYNHRLLVRSGWGLNSSTRANWQKSTAWEQILTRNTCPKSFTDIINSTTTKSAYYQIGDLLIQWGVFIGAHGDTTNWTVTYPKTFYWYPSVILQTKDTTTNSGIPYSNGAVITSYNGRLSFTFQLRRSESCPVYWLAIGGLQ